MHALARRKGLNSTGLLEPKLTRIYIFIYIYIYIYIYIFLIYIHIYRSIFLYILDSHMAPYGALFGPQVFNFLSHRIHKSLIFIIFCKLKFQCTRKVNQNHLFCPGSPQNTCMIVLRYFKTSFCFYKHFPNNRKSGNLKI